MLAAREQRVRPGLDDKRLTSWNALMISALADAGAAMGRSDYLDAATGAARFIWDELRDADGHLLRTWKDGEGRLNAYLEDHAFLLEALLRLYEATFEQRWFDAARETADAMIARFGDDERGGFFTTSSDHEELIARRKDMSDHPIPSGNASAALGPAAPRGADRRGLLRGAGRRHDPPARRAGLAPPRGLRPPAPGARLPHLPHARGRAGRRRRARDASAEVVHSEHRPHVVLAGGPEGTERPELMAGRTAVDGKPAAYVCEHFACKAPVTGADELRASLA